ncbi:hypothetical protein IT414_03190 [bacterium]|nr:hypothetical protein [bacterium]
MPTPTSDVLRVCSASELFFVARELFAAPATASDMHLDPKQITRVGARRLIAITDVELELVVRQAVADLHVIHAIIASLRGICLVAKLRHLPDQMYQVELPEEQQHNRQQSCWRPTKAFPANPTQEDQSSATNAESTQLLNRLPLTLGQLRVCHRDEPSSANGNTQSYRRHGITTL